MSETTTGRAIPAVAFVGKQNSGKTTLLEKLIATLSDHAIRVATIKHHSHAGFEFDIKGKDSWRHRQAGSIHTIVAAPDQIASVHRTEHEVDLQTLIDMLCFETSHLGDASREAPHIILVEGYRHAKLSTIELFRAGNPADEERELGAEGNEIIAVVTNMPRVAAQAQEQELPVFDFEDISPLAHFLIDRFITPQTL
jgi:molybdopterin-guanine dinucleotide biosynthesis protein MobB